MEVVVGSRFKGVAPFDGRTYSSQKLKLSVL